MRISLLGTGYVGLVTGTCLADVGHDVVCMDVDAQRIAALANGVVPIHEPGLSPLVRTNLASGRLRFTAEPDTAITHADVVFIAVGTPADEDGSADLTHVLAAARTIGRLATHDLLVVIKSTVPIGTATQVRAVIAAELQARGRGTRIAVASNPEFLKEGDAIADCMRPGQIVIGASDDAAAETLRRLYAPLNRHKDRIVVMDIPSAELTKYAANVMLAARISLMNEIASIAERVGADIEMVRQGIGSDPRIGFHFLYAGAGYGGSCFPKDVRALMHTATEHGLSPQLIPAVDAVNQAQKQRLFQLVQSHYEGGIAWADIRSLGPGIQARH
jgi:UDPglucose 6-dehydrogenase